MGKEIERKFLVQGEPDLRTADEKVFIEQGFLSLDKSRIVRIRLAGGLGTVTIKGSVSGITRSEYEYSIPEADARQILDEMCIKPVVRKYRYRVRHQGSLWEVDVFEGENKGLILAEIELENEDQFFEKPSWLGKEVTTDPRYYNANLVKNPFSTW